MNKKILFAVLIVLLPLNAVAGKVTGAKVVEPFYRLVCEVFTNPYIPVSLAVLMWAYAGAKWVWSQDDDEQRMLAKDIAMYVLIGLVILITAREIVRIMFGVYACK